MMLFAFCATAAEPVFLDRWTLETPNGDVALALPAHFDHLLPRQKTEVRLRSEADLPSGLRDREVKLVIPYYPARTSLLVDGVLAERVDEDLVTGYRARGPQTFRFKSNREHVKLELVVEHNWTQSGWFDTVPRILPLEQRDGAITAVRAVNDYASAFAFATLAQIGLTYLAVFLAGRKRRSYLWFAIQGWTASYLHLFYLGFTQGVFGSYDVAVLAVLISAAPIASVWMTHDHFQLGPVPRIFVGLFALDIIAAIVFAGPFDATRIAAKTTVATVGVVIVYQIWILGRLSLKKPRPLGADLMLATWVILAVGSIDDVTAWLGFGELLGGPRANSVALAVFALIQSIVLAREHISSLARSDELNVALAKQVEDLEARQREVQHLNEELRRQIADRSRQLFGALALLGPQRGVTPPTLEPGSLVEDRYKVVKPIGVGGMGTVYEVIRVADAKHFALKLTRDLDSHALARLAREAQIASTIAHPNVVGIVDVDVSASGFLYLVLELVEGPTLKIVKPRFTDAAWAQRVLHQIAAGLDALHAHGIIHRDLKPANVLVVDPDSDAPVVKITDFGISRLLVDAMPTLDRPPDSVHRPAPDDAPTRAIRPGASTPKTTKAASDSSSPLTQTGQLVGTPTYIAPELALDPTKLSPAADVFSLGVMAFELLVGKLPFAYAPSLARAEGRSVRPPPALASLRPDLPSDVAETLDACLALEPEKRPTTEKLVRVFAA